MLLLAELRSAWRLDFSRACLDGARVPSPEGISHRSHFTDRGKLGSKRHLATASR